MEKNVNTSLLNNKSHCVHLLQNSCWIPAQWRARLSLLVHPGAVHRQHRSVQRRVSRPPLSPLRPQRQVKCLTITPHPAWSAAVALVWNVPVVFQVSECGHGVAVWGQWEQQHGGWHRLSATGTAAGCLCCYILVTSCSYLSAATWWSAQGIHFSLH